jgi:hypothetical protein
MSIVAEEPRSPKRNFAFEFVNASGAKPVDNIIVAGAGNLDLLVEFIHRGYSHVVCQSEHGPHITAQPADILIAPHLKSKSDFDSVMTQLVRDLSPHGAIIVSCAHGSSFTEWDLRRLLKEKGFRTLRQTTSNKGAGTILCARREAASVARAA